MSTHTNKRIAIKSRIFVSSAALAVAALLGGCTPGGYVSAEALDGLLDPILSRHDAYVVADPAKDPDQKERETRSSEIVRTMVQEALPQK